MFTGLLKYVRWWEAGISEVGQQHLEPSGSFPGYTLRSLTLATRVVPNNACSHMHLLVQTHRGVSLTFSHSCGRGYENTVQTKNNPLTSSHADTLPPEFAAGPTCHFLSIILLLLLSQVLKSTPSVPHLTLHYLSGQAFSPSSLEGPVCGNDPQTPESSFWSAISRGRWLASVCLSAACGSWVKWGKVKMDECAEKHCACALGPAWPV